jgi:predicted nucleic-acid-binding Zn-ribbon protein
MSELVAKFKCPKCGHREGEAKQVATVGGAVSRFFNFQYHRFTAVICSRCRYTELYAADASRLADIFDAIGSG